METSIDHSRELDLEDGEFGADFGFGALQVIEFDVDGRSYLLINYFDWLRHQTSGAASLQARHPVVGRILFNGERHVVIERPSQPIADEALAKLELVDVLTRRELQVALLVSEGKCDKEIARTLGISVYTVREHLRRTFAKLNVSKRTAIVSYVLQRLRDPIEPLAARDV
jgi:DNA-binding CsgD family transcriptional regulator